MSFFVTLPSSINSGTTSDYTTILAQQITFNQKYQVALVEFIYNHSWKLDMGFLLIYNQKDELNKIPIYLENSYTIDSLILKLNEEIKEFILRNLYNQRYEEKIRSTEKLYPNYSYDSPIKNSELILELKNTDEYKLSPYFLIQDKRLIIHHTKSNFLKLFGLEGRILTELGYDTELVVFEKNQEIQFPNIINTTKQLKISGPIYIYAPDLIEWQYVGNTRAPLLRTVVVEPNLNDNIIWVNFENPHYVDVRERFLTQIKIYIRDEFNEKILFDFSDITLKLHFKPV